MLRILLLASLTALTPAQDFPTKADAYVQSWTRDGQFCGAILVAKDGQPIFRKGYGLANSEWDIPNSPETKFRLARISHKSAAKSCDLWDNCVSTQRVKSKEQRLLL